MSKLCLVNFNYYVHCKSFSFVSLDTLVTLFLSLKIYVYINVAHSLAF